MNNNYDITINGEEYRSISSSKVQELAKEAGYRRVVFRDDGYIDLDDYVAAGKVSSTVDPGQRIVNKKEKDSTTFLLRNVPDDIWRKAKATAAMRGVSIRRMIIDSLSNM